tara:strand:+ start:513 stop:842 length:330 start_codon:yes stop_codon:yes gene_type:complete
MKKIILLISILVSTLAFGQEEVPNSVLGAWYNLEGEILTITRELDSVVFVRTNKTSTLATGMLTMSNGDLHITRFDTKDEYHLAYGITGTTLVITQPRSVRAWLWTKIQ